MTQNLLPSNVAIETLNVAPLNVATPPFVAISKFMYKKVLCQYLSNVSELGNSYLSDRNGFAVLVEIKVIFVGIIN
jgi:hypothetical protein